MIDKEKLLKLRKLADAMYYAAQHLTTDASRLHKAMDEYHQFIINEYHKKEPTIPDIVDEHFYEMLEEEPVSEQKLSNSSNIGKDCKEEPASEDLEEAAITATDEDMQGRQIMKESSENRQLYSRIFRRGFKAGAKRREQQMISKAIDSQCFGFQGDALFSFKLPADNYLVGSEVKVIVIKEDEL